MRLRFVTAAALLSVLAVVACSSDPDPVTASPDVCPSLPQSFRFPSGGDGHADPFGAKAAGQARAGRVTRPDQIVQPEDARHKVRVGDFALANDKVALYIEAEGESDGYFPYGGEILRVEPVGDDGRPRGVGDYGETALAIGIQTIAPEKVSVLADGSDGKAAIVRASGTLKNIPILETFKILGPDPYDLPVALDYVLEPGAERVSVRFSIANTRVEAIEFREFVMFFQSYRAPGFTPEAGFAAPSGAAQLAAWATDRYGFGFRSTAEPLRPEISVSGFQLFSRSKETVEACSQRSNDVLEMVAGGPGLDGLLEAKRRAYGEAAWREVRGTVKEDGGAGLPGVVVHATAADGRYLTRTTTDASGAFVMHVPSEGALLTPTPKGWAVPAATTVGGGQATADLVVPRRATIEVNAKDVATSEAIPVRVQVIPQTPVAPPPASWGVKSEVDGRLWQEFAVTGKATLPVPPGSHRVIVSRGFGYEIVDQTVSAEAGKAVVVDAPLARSVPASGSLCADFHVHSNYSADSQDGVEAKVKAAISDGLDIPVSSEHEYVIDFQPYIQRLGLTRWAFGMPSEELTTFTWGHFGVVPIVPKPDQVNNGAIGWVGNKPAQVFAAVNALAERPALIVNHPSGGGFGGYFSAASLDRATGKGSAELWSDDFAAIEVFNDSDLDANRSQSVEDWFALLNAGKTYWAVGNSDSHDQRTTHVGYPRTCFAFGTDDVRALTLEKVRDAIKGGTGYVSGGLALDVAAPNGARPGGQGAAGTYTVTVRAPSWITANKLEVFVDGVSTRTLDLVAKTPAQGELGKRYEATVDVQPTSSKARHFVVFHAKGDGDLAPVHPGKKVFAVSNPIFF